MYPYIHLKKFTKVDEETQIESEIELKSNHNITI